MHFLVTGHTGFKGAWIALLLRERGHEVSGLSLSPVNGALYETAKIGELLKNDVRCDIRDLDQTIQLFSKIDPEIVIHMAAQSLVKEGYRDPSGTHSTNVLGTSNVLIASERLTNIKARVVVTTDKVYKNKHKFSGYVESDELGGLDPYSASKAEADLLTQNWMNQHTYISTGIARAGNVIGGGDVCKDRLVPELISAYSENRIPKLRYPNAVRPWQHVLDCLNGYLKIVDALVSSNSHGVWNIGPQESEVRTVSEVSEFVAKEYGIKKAWVSDADVHSYEAELLLLNADKALSQLNWREKLDFETSLLWTTKWYREVQSGKSARRAMLENIRTFESIY